MNDLAEKTSEELRHIISEIEAELQKRASKDRQDARRKILEMAELHNINLANLNGGKASGARAVASRSNSARTVAPRYRNPADTAQTWTGRGRQPLWFRDALTHGKTAQELEIK